MATAVRSARLLRVQYALANVPMVSVSTMSHDDGGGSGEP
ncbi:hypothetical protein HNR25_003683 [Streptomonospora salina]|uniref:Uncharacterized protein n=1 Tax=Streptomonospora salina TaxID=104205 RepID=A0A841EAA5_9ACTN|nr:hypothetical protein [Streptomonospora salina]